MCEITNVNEQPKTTTTATNQKKKHAKILINKRTVK